MKLSTPSREPIYPGEELNMGTFQIRVKKENNSKFLENLVVDMILFYPGGQDDLAYIPSSHEFVSDREKIDNLIAEKNNLLHT